MFGNGLLAYLVINLPGRGSAWLERLLWEQEVPSSNLGAPMFPMEFAELVRL